MAESAEPRSLAVFGSTGSVGRSTLDLVAQSNGDFQVDVLTAHRSVSELAEQARRHGCNLAVIAEPELYSDLKDALAGEPIEVAAGAEALVEAAERASDLVMAAIVGAAGLPATMAAVRRGATIALANKETLICAGPLVMEAVSRHGATFLPVDSEHNAIFQVLEDKQIDYVDRIVLTASGGPFRTMAQDDMEAVTPAQAVAHPNWSMGAKISVDSATMMNKGLEIIEAHHLFGLPSEQIDVVVHPQSIIHSLVAYKDGSMLAQLGVPDMRVPIAYALSWPQRMATNIPQLDLVEVATLTFEPPDMGRFPALRLAREALCGGGGAPTVLNAANEVAVAAFLEGGIGFLDICRTIERALERFDGSVLGGLEDVLALDADARRFATETLSNGSGGLARAVAQ